MDNQRRENVKNYFANQAPNSLKVTPSTLLSMYVDGKLVGVVQNDVEPVPNPIHSVMHELDESKALHRLQKVYPNADVEKLPRHWDKVADPWVREAPILAQNRKRNVRSHHASVMLQLSIDQLRVTKTRAIAWKCFSCASLRANRPIPLALTFYYFEVSVVSKGQDCFIGVGLSQANVPFDRLPGWDNGSYGYHADDGCFYASSVKGVKYGPTFTTGDVVGCGVNFETRKLFFTKNGQHLGFAKAQPLTLGSVPLYPTVGMQSSGEMIDANFGQKPFVYDLQKAIDECHDAKRGDGDVEEAPPLMMSNNPAMATIQIFQSPPRMKAVKREHTNPLRRWLYEHAENPYPTLAEKEALAMLTKLSISQVSTGLANARRLMNMKRKAAGLPPIKKPWEEEGKSSDGVNLTELCQKPANLEGPNNQSESLESFVALSNEEHLEKLTLDAKAEKNGQEGICQSDQSQPESDLCSCPSESDVCSSLMESMCFAEVFKKLLDKNEKLTVEKEECARKAYLEKARADRAVLEVVELKKKVALLEQEKLQISRNSFISPNQCYYLKYISNELAFLHVSSSGNWDKTVPDQLLSCRFKLMLHLDGTFSIYSTFSNKFLEYNKMPGIFGLTDNYCSLDAKFEFLYAGQDQCQYFLVKIRSMSGDGYLIVNCLAKKSYSVGISEYATKFTLVPANE